MISEAEYRKKVLACWYGKNIGGTLGGPYEGFPVVNHLTFYDPVPTGSMPNDDLELQAMYAAALDRMEKPCVSRETLADIWSKHMKFMCDEYAVAVRNLEMGLRPPWTGRFDNHFTCGMGAAIRSELWACLAPGNPGLAAKFAYEDACIDHDGAGVDAEVFNAVVESLAFVEPDVRKLTEAGLEYLPADSTLAAGIREAISLWDETHDWLHCRNVLFEKYASEAATDVRINLPFTVLALLSGNGDFGKTICDAVNCGMDTDCTGATAGAILGILNPDGIPEEWMKPVGKELVVRTSMIPGLDFPPTLDAFTDQILSLKKRIPQSVPDSPEIQPDFEKYRIPYEVAFQKNLRWFFVNLPELKWRKMKTDPINGSLEVPPEYRGNGGQIVLRFTFELPKDGEYWIMFNSPSSNQVYLDPDAEQLHDDRDMLFGRQRLFMDQERADGMFACCGRPVVFSPTLGGAPMNQIKRYLQLKAGRHTLIAAVEPLCFESKIRWGLSVGLRTDLLNSIIYK